ncbi:hypothetical protein B0H13DRAFT_543358 [Mycena leptocephala]|nr:hypothetical protein B0H13DRAFT_543358 [Mycena leptocephala]
MGHRSWRRGDAARLNNPRTAVFRHRDRSNTPRNRPLDARALQTHPGHAEARDPRLAPARGELHRALQLGARADPWGAPPPVPGHPSSYAARATARGLAPPGRWAHSYRRGRIRMGIPYVPRATHDVPQASRRPAIGRYRPAALLCPPHRHDHPPHPRHHASVWVPREMCESRGRGCTPPAQSHGVEVQGPGRRARSTPTLRLLQKGASLVTYANGYTIPRCCSSERPCLNSSQLPRTRFPPERSPCCPRAPPSSIASQPRASSLTQSRSALWRASSPIHAGIIQTLSGSSKPCSPIWLSICIPRTPRPK